ncbi:hypothetical protein [Halomonas hibernica]|uniref:hypothetical protein n=1 Tax=Halomonas hibernica TaxID=2591147 RepID=UPI0015574F31|nr:hypothetical protein [Halomonas hibernica]
MTPEVTRRHYLDAMGITAWASRYQLPNALPTEACEWDETPPERTPPRERLQALLDDAPTPRSEPKAPSVNSPAPAPSSVRALLGQAPADKPPTEPMPVESVPVEAVPGSMPAVSAKPLQFSLSCVCIGQRWLSLHPGEITPQAQRLLANIWQAVGIAPDALSSVTLFKWPLMANTFAEDPLEEAREGLSAFMSGCASRQGWALERVLWWGEQPEDDSAADILSVLNIQQARSDTLELPIWQGVALEHLAKNGAAKRDLWPQLYALGQQWKTLNDLENDR